MVVVSRSISTVFRRPGTASLQGPRQPTTVLPCREPHVRSSVTTARRSLSVCPAQGASMPPPSGSCPSTSDAPTSSVTSADTWPRSRRPNVRTWTLSRGLSWDQLGVRRRSAWTRASTSRCSSWSPTRTGPRTRSIISQLISSTRRCSSNVSPYASRPAGPDGWDTGYASTCRKATSQYGWVDPGFQIACVLRGTIAEHYQLGNECNVQA